MVKCNDFFSIKCDTNSANALTCFTDGYDFKCVVGNLSLPISSFNMKVFSVCVSISFT